jgi:hypothetical protein
MSELKLELVFYPMSPYLKLPRSRPNSAVVSAMSKTPVAEFIDPLWVLKPA